LWMLRVTQDTTMIIASQVVMIPLFSNLIQYSEEHVTIGHFVISSLFNVFVYALMITTYRHNRLCTIFEETWPTRCSMVPWGLDTGLINNHENVAHITASLVTFDSSASRDIPGKYTTRKAPTKLLPVANDVHEPLEPQTSEQLFNSLYGCHMYKNDPSADVVHIIDHDHKLITVKLSEDFNMYSQLYSTDGIARNGVLANGVHMAQMGAAPHLFHNYIDEDGSITRKMIGVLTEWRRYYILNLFIDAILLASLLNITDVMGTCVV
jgi:hypothetical protein